MLRALLPFLALVALEVASARAQTVTPDLFNPLRSSFVAPQDSPLRKIAAGNTGEAGSDPSDGQRARDAVAPSRIGRIPTYGLPAASGAKGAGCASLNRK